MDKNTVISYELRSTHIQGSKYEHVTDLYVSDEAIPPEHVSSSGKLKQPLLSSLESLTMKKESNTSEVSSSVMKESTWSSFPASEGPARRCGVYHSQSKCFWDRSMVC